MGAIPDRANDRDKFGKIPDPHDIISAVKAGYITNAQAGHLHPGLHAHLAKKGYMEKDENIDRVNQKVDNIKYGNEPEGKNWRIG
jgi:hypothetical protein